MDSSIPVPDAPATSSSEESPLKVSLLRYRYRSAADELAIPFKEPKSESPSQMAVSYPSEFYAPYFSALSKTWFAGPSAPSSFVSSSVALIRRCSYDFPSSLQFAASCFWRIPLAYYLSLLESQTHQPFQSHHSPWTSTLR